MQITAKKMADRGTQHAKNGGKLTPVECQSIDAELFAAMRTMDRMAGAKFYNAMRGAFNRAWQAAYAESVRGA